MEKILKVPLIPQKTETWCWAASAEMIMMFEGHDVSQGDQVNFRLRRDDCGNTPIPAKCVVPDGWPDFDHWGFHSDKTETGTGLRFEELKNQIDSNMPVAFAVSVKGTCHMKVAIGYDDSNENVYVNDPWLQGNTQLIPYKDYLSDPDHYVDYYNIHPIAAGFVKAGGAVMQMGKTSVIHSAGYDNPETAAGTSIKLLPGLATLETAKGLRFDDEAIETSTLTLGKPLTVFYITHDSLHKHVKGTNVRKLLASDGELIYPIIKEGKEIYSVTVMQKGGKWLFMSLGNANLTKDLAEVRKKLGQTFRKAQPEYFLVHIPSSNIIFVGHYDGKGFLKLTHVHDNAEYGFTKHVTHTGKYVISMILSQAKLRRSTVPDDR